MKEKTNPFLSATLLTAALGLTAVAQATTFTWDGTNNAPWSDAKWSDGVNSAINWVNGATNDAVVNNGYVYATSGITANSLTIGDGIGAAGSAEAKSSTTNAFWSIGSITINSDGLLSGGGNMTTHLRLVTLNGGNIGGGDNGGLAAQYGIFNFDNTVHVTADSTISVTGAGVTLGQSGGTQFNVDSTKTLSVTGIIVHKDSSSDTGLIKTGDGTMNLTNTNTYTGGTTVNAGTLGLGIGGSSGAIRGTLTINSGATVKLNATDALGYGGTPVTQVNINDGTLDNAVAGNNGYKTNFTLTGGTIPSTGGGRIHFTTGYGISTLSSSNASTVSSGIELRDSNIMTISVANGAAPTDLLISGAIVGGAGGINKTGDGTLTLSSAGNTYNGATNVNDAGKLIVNGNISTSSMTTVASTATLAGIGTVGAATVNGTLTPGDGGIESLNFASLTLSNTSSSLFEINTAGDAADLAIASAAMFFDGALTVANIGAALANGDVFNLFDWGSVSGTFDSVSLPTLTGDLTWDQSQLYTNGTITVVPEPNVAALFGGLGMFALLRRRR